MESQGFRFVWLSVGAGVKGIVRADSLQDQLLRNDLGARVKENKQRDDDELRARLETLKEEMEAGRVHFAPHLNVVESLMAVRHGPDGKVDLSTVASGVRALANAVAYSRQRREAKEAVSLRDLQSTYFDFIEKKLRLDIRRYEETGSRRKSLRLWLLAQTQLRASRLECLSSWS